MHKSGTRRERFSKNFLRLLCLFVANSILQNRDNFTARDASELT